MNTILHAQLATQLDAGQEIIFFHDGLVIFMQEHSSEGFEFDIGEREDNETTNHFDGGFFDGTASDAIVFATELAEDINVQFAEVIAANMAHERDENRGIA